MANILIDGTAMLDNDDFYARTVCASIEAQRDCESFSLQLV